MNRFPVGLVDSDYYNLDVQINGPKTYKLADVKDKIEKVAYDVVRFRDADGLDKLWLIEEKNGEQVIVAMYDEEENSGQIEARSWVAVPDKSNSNVNVFYKGEPITRFALESLNLDSKDALSVCRCLPNKLASDKNFRATFLNDLSKNDKDELYNRYPELKG